MSQSEEDVSESGSEESSEFDTDVIDWDEAMEQCGDDEDFLRELLADLRGEISAQLEKIDDSLETLEDQPYHRIMRAAHVIKGAASNLMCQTLRQAATDLEKNASNANNAATLTDELKSEVQKSYEDLQEAVEAYREFLDDIGV